VFAIEGSGSGLKFVTKGDANKIVDPATPASHLIGRVVLIMPFVGRLTNFVRSFWGWLLMILLPGGILVIWETYDLVRGKKRKQATLKILVLALCLFGSAQTAMASSTSAGTTSAFFATQAVASAKIQTGSWPCLSCEPGKAKAVRHGNGRASFPIASKNANGKLTLDFGEIPAGNSNNSNDVFEIAINAKAPMTVTLSVQGRFAGLVESISLGKGDDKGQLASGETQSVNVKLKVPAGTTPGDYRGTITATPDDGSAVVISAMVTVSDDGSAKGTGTTSSATTTTLATEPVEPTTPSTTTTATSEDQVTSTTVVVTRTSVGG
jgi:hypothetical protein